MGECSSVSWIFIVLVIILIAWLLCQYHVPTGAQSGNTGGAQDCPAGYVWNGSTGECRLPEANSNPQVSSSEVSSLRSSPFNASCTGVTCPQGQQCRIVSVPLCS